MFLRLRFPNLFVRPALAAFLVLSAASGLDAQDPQQSPWPMLPEGTAPSEGEIWGSLDNGLKYVVVPAEQQEEVISLRLVVAAGRAHEPEAASGVAEALQRLVFSGTQRFDRDELARFLLENGMDPQARSYAKTELYHTVFQFDLDHGPDDGMEKAFQIFSDVAGGLDFANDEVAAVRSVLLKEVESGVGAFETRAGTLDQVVYRESPYAGVDVKELQSGLAALEAEGVREFWKQWYRPDRMTLVVVGAVDGAETVALIENSLGTLESAGDTARSPAEPSGRTRSEGDFEVVASNDAFARLTIAYGSDGFDLYDPQSERRYHEIGFIGRYAQSLAVGSSRLTDDATQIHRSRLLLTLNARGSVIRFQDLLRDADRAVHRLLENGIPASDLPRVKEEFRELTAGYDTELSAREWPPLIANRLVQCLVEGVPFRRGEAYAAYLDEVIGRLTPERTQELCSELFNLKRLTYLVQLPPSFMLTPKVIGKRMKSLRKSYDFTWDQAGELKKNWNLNSGFAATGVVESSNRVALGPHQALQYVFRNKVRVNVVPTQNRPGEVLMRLSLGNGITDLKRPFPGVEILTRALLAKMTVGGGGSAAEALTVAKALESEGLESIEGGANADQMYWTARGENGEDVLSFLSTLTIWMVAGQLKEEDFDAEIESMKRAASMDMGVSSYRRVDELLFGSEARLRRSYLESDLENVDYESFMAWLAETREKGYIEMTIVGDVEPRTILRDVRKTFGSVPDRSGKVIQPRHGKPAELPELGIVHEVLDTPSEIGYLSVYWTLPEPYSCETDTRLTALHALFNEYVAQSAKARSDIVSSITVEKMGNAMVPHSSGLRIDLKCLPENREEAERFLLDLGSTFNQSLTPELVSAAERWAWIDMNRTTRNDSQLAHLFDQSQGKPSKFGCLTKHLKSGVSYDFASYEAFAASLLAEGNARGFSLMPMDE